MIDHTTSHRGLARHAAAALREDAPLDPAEQAAEAVIRKSTWILWHAKGSRDLAVIRLLHRAGLLRDREKEREESKAHASMQRLDKADHAAHRVLAGTLTNLVDEAIRALREGRDPGELADQMEAARQRAQEQARQRLGLGVTDVPA